MNALPIHVPMPAFVQTARDLIVVIVLAQAIQEVLVPQVSNHAVLHAVILCKSKREDKNQETVPLNTTPYPVHHMGRRQNTSKHHIQVSQEVSLFQTGDHKTLRNKHDRV